MGSMTSAYRGSLAKACVRVGAVSGPNPGMPAAESQSKTRNPNPKPRPESA
jgi:hypothetical protein